MERVDLKQIFMKLQNQMIAQLSTNREIITQPGTKGDASELNWIEMLNTYLPERYKVDKAFVLDSGGDLSEQIDIVIYDRQYSPFLFHQDGAIYIPAESVYAVFEVKQTISKEKIEYAGNKFASVRRLKRTSVPISHAGGEYKAKEHFEILSGILALESDWKPPLDSSLIKSLDSLNKPKRIDLGCVLRAGGFEVSYEPTVKLDKSKKENSLIFFFLKLLNLLQRIGTVPALDISEYGKFLK
jgi:hypothetical protein